MVGFSCKSDFSGKSTLFNASQDSINFRFEIVNGCNDAIMNDINSTKMERDIEEFIANIILKTVN